MPALFLNSTWNFPGWSSLLFTFRVAPPAFCRVDFASRIYLLSSFSCARFSLGSTDGSKYFDLAAESFHTGGGLDFVAGAFPLCFDIGLPLLSWPTPLPMPDFYFFALVDLFRPPEFDLLRLAFETVMGSGCSDLKRPVSSTSILKASYSVMKETFFSAIFNWAAYCICSVLCRMPL